MVEVETELLQKLIAGLNSPTVQIKTFYQGKVETPPRDLLPCLMLFGSGTSASTAVTKGDTGNDWVEYTMNIRVVSNLRDYQKDIGTPTTSGVRVLSAPVVLKQLIEGRDLTTGNYLANSILGTLRSRTNMRGIYYTYNNTFLINYQQLSKPDMPLIWVDITFKVQVALVQRPGY